MNELMDLLMECEELLHGRRPCLTPWRQYQQERLAYWRNRAEGGAEGQGALAGSPLFARRPRQAGLRESRAIPIKTRGSMQG